MLLATIFSLLASVGQVRAQRAVREDMQRLQHVRKVGNDETLLNMFFHTPPSAKF